MLRIAAAIVFSIGALLLILGMTRVLPAGTTPTAFSLIFFSAVLGGLSFIRKPQPAPDAPPPMSPVARVLGVFYEPARVFQNLRAHPRWLAAFVVIVLVNIIYMAAFTQRLTAERIAEFTVSKVIESGLIPDDQVGRVREQAMEEARVPMSRVNGAVNQVVWLFVGFAFLSGVILLIVLMFGGRINFWQAFCVSLYAWLPLAVISKIVSLIILFIKSPDDIHPIRGQQTLLQDNLGILFSPAQNPVLFSVASMFGLLLFYWVWLKATGLRNGGEKVSSGAAWGVAITLWVLFFVFNVVASALFGNFIS
jgi:hypothetical protein